MQVATPSLLLPRSIEVHDHGHVCLEAILGNELSIVNNARVSFDQESTEFGDSERGLLRFLMVNRHGSPWEAIVFRFDVKANLTVIREWERHRIGSFNEQSARYSVIPDDFYVPEPDYIREQVGKPGNYSFNPITDPEVVTEAIRVLRESQEASFKAYHELLDAGVAKEVARTVLPVGMYSRMKWTVNLRSLLNFLALRNHEHAQKEIRDYATAVEELVTEQLPFVMELFNSERVNRVAP